MLEKPVDGPSPPNGEPNGPEPAGVEPPSADPAKKAPAAAPEPEVGQRRAPVPAASADPAVLAALGEPGTLPATWCRNCEADVIPLGKGQCPRCGRMLRQNFVARRHPINVLRKQQLLDQLLAEYQPRNTVMRSSCEQLAGILEQLEAIKPGSPDHTRLVQLSQQLGAALEESREARERERERELASSRRAIESMPTSAIGALEGLLKRVVAGEALSDFDQGRLAVLNAAASGEIALPPDPTPPPAPPSTDPPFDSSPVVTVERKPPGPAVSESESTPVADVKCPHGCGSLDRCAEIKATRPEDWQALHHHDPEVVRQRDELATAEMFESVRRQRRGTW